ncbi:MAG: ribose 5-phosphate isomerase B [Planctomycetota bacterium]|jgi:RpiB/LacA/LacB family sugar-phosphate isomerase
MENPQTNAEEIILGIGTDHAGVELKEKIFYHLREKGWQIENFGVDSSEPIDYPDIAVKIGEAVATGEITRGILVCGTGIGISIAANKVKGIRAALCVSREAARLSRTHNDANVIVLAGRDATTEDPLAIVDEWLKHEFSEEERHRKRIAKISSYENSN